MFIDAHAHLDPKSFDDPEAVIRRAFEAGVDQLVVVGIGVELAEGAVRLAERHPGRLFAVVGVHPHDVADMTPADLETLRALAARPEVVGVGETGLDYYYDHSPREAQQEGFVQFLRLAKAVGKPVVIHTRDAEPDTIAILRAEAPYPAGGQLHCFTGTQTLADAALAVGLHVSFAGVVTFNNADPLRAVARTVPNGRLLVETDCPYLTPAPFRGMKNEPMLVTTTAARLAEVRGASLEAIAELTSTNARTLFRLPPPPPTDALAFSAGDALWLEVWRDDVPPERLIEAAGRVPLKKIARLVAHVPAGRQVHPPALAAVKAWAEEIARPLVEQPGADAPGRGG